MLKTLIAALSVLTFSFHAALAQPLASISDVSQPQIFTQWVQSRCIASIADSAALKADANASAAAWLEASELPVEAFNAADAVIAQALKTRVGGTAKTDYRVLKCALIAQSADVQALYQQFARQKAQ
ncbi:T6SS amidase immunity protein Tai4 family protein [Cronobacter dublinensis]|uniref:T6SS amidase immunity protein Tai4 family protein n=1 Tax=Cronobacter dublinensis TaxID=413497 RepID=UPI000CFD52BE|nr:T6SS amidase immunity protein Tai4 family protein [Cronobacter dublinensis]